MKSWTSLASAMVLTIGLPVLAKPMTAVLRLQPKIPMSVFAADVQNPSSPRYHKYYTPEELRTMAGPADGDYNNLLAQLRADGFTITSESATHLWISISGDSTLFEKEFSTQLKPMPNGARKMMIEAKIPAQLPLVAGISGLDSTRHSMPKFSVHASAFDQNSGIPQATIKAAYGLAPLYTQGLSGAGQNIAIATYYAFNISEVQTFYTTSGLQPGPTVDQVTFNGTAPADPNGEANVETELDSEFSGMIAPGAAIHVFASATNDDTGETQLFTAILDDNRSQVVNYSWGDCEPDLTSAHATEMEPIFQRAVAQGINIVAASGDYGSETCYPVNGSTATAADWPAADDNVVAVGGTSFAYTNNQIAETAWSGSGGGISTLWALPSWQANLGTAYTMRSYPDVAFNADPDTGQAMYASYQNQPAIWLIIGGTSMAAPQWSGFLALINQARANAGLTTLGYLPPQIYGLAATVKSGEFNDITSGSNGAYTAGPGWDAVTGWGSMQGANLLKQLTQTN